MHKSRSASALLFCCTLHAQLELSGLTLQSMRVHPFGDDRVEIEAVLVMSAIQTQRLDDLVSSLSEDALVAQAFWSPSVKE